MPTLLLRLCGPMQSWGTRSRFVERDTELEPSKSGVIGILCAAAGVPRTEPIPREWLSLRMGVRCDRPGHLARDYQTAGGDGSGIARADGGRSNNAVLSNRYYLADADFLVGLEGPDRAVLESIEGYLRAPRWQLCLGRKAFLPALPIHLPPKHGGGVRDRALEDSLLGEPFPLEPQVPTRRRTTDTRVRLVIECGPDETSAEIRPDQPRPGSFVTRVFDRRMVRTSFDTPRSPSDE